jgi:opacity protein-like surface antigen
MNSTPILSASAWLLFTGVAIAADLPSKKPSEAPAAPMWTGFYMGLSAGGASEDSAKITYGTYPSVSGNYLTNPIQVALRAPFWATQNGTTPGSGNAGFIGGAQFGYNWRKDGSDEIIYGIEGDIQGLASRSGNRSIAAPFGNILATGDRLLNSASGNSSLAYLATLRARLGYLATPELLVYATGGLAFGGSSFNVATSAIYTNAANVVVQDALGNINTLSTLFGWSVGGGFEWMFMPHWSLKVEHIYYSLGSGNVRMPAAAYPVGVPAAFGGVAGVPSDWTLSNIASPRVTGNIARVGVNYHFDSTPAPARHAGGGGHDGAQKGEMKGKGHTVVPAGVQAAHMVPAGVVRFNYLPSYAVMRGNFIGSSQISSTQVTIIPWVPNSVYSLGNFFAANPTRTLRNAPDNMKMQMHMFSVHYGITDWLNVMVMGSVSDKNMCMNVFSGPSGAVPRGQTNSATQGWGDTSVQGLFRLYQDDIHHVHVNLGLSLPTGSIDQDIIHMHPSGQFFQRRAYYGLQLGTGTYDGLFGLTYTGKEDAWSWGFSYRGRVALGDNNAGYLRGPWNELTAWGGYEVLPGVNATGRVATTLWDRIYGHDNLIYGAQQGTVPYYQGGERVRLLGGLEYMVKIEGFKPIRIAVEAGAPVYQRLNGPQLGESWELNTALGFGF